jgi:hypothetical protein
MNPRLAFALLALLALVPAAGADKWTPFAFHETERFEFKTEMRDGDRMVEGGYILELKPTDKKNAEGQTLIEVSVTTRSFSAKDRIESDPAGEVMGRHAVGMSMMTMNPMYAAIFQQVDMTVGEKMSLFGAGVVKVTATEKIADHDGFVCQYFQPGEGGKDQMVAEYVIDPALALPLRSKMFSDGALQSSMELTAYTRGE